MLSRINLTMDEKVIVSAKRYAKKHKTSISSLTEKYFRELTHTSENESVVEFLKSKAPVKKTPDGKRYLKTSLKKKYGN